MNLMTRAKIDDPGGAKAPDPMARELIVTEKKPPCDVCGSLLHGLKVTRSGASEDHGVNFFCLVATREEMRSDQLEPCPDQIAKYYQYDETNLAQVFDGMRKMGYGRFVTSATMDMIENRTREICRENSGLRLPNKKRKIEGKELDTRSPSSGKMDGLNMGGKLSKG